MTFLGFLAQAKHLAGFQYEKSEDAAPTYLINYLKDFV